MQRVLKGDPSRGVMIGDVPYVPGPPPAATGRCDACGETDRVQPQVVAGVDLRLCVVTLVCARRTRAVPA